MGVVVSVCLLVLAESDQVPRAQRTKSAMSSQIWIPRPRSIGNGAKANAQLQILVVSPGTKCARIAMASNTTRPPQLLPPSQGKTLFLLPSLDALYPTMPPAPQFEPIVSTK